MITKRIDAITKIPKEYRKAIVPAPKSVKIELTSKCDLGCFFCATSYKLRKHGNMDFSFLVKLLHELQGIGVKEIGLFYLGESLLYSRLADAIKTAKDIGFEYVFLTTNGRSLTGKKAREIMTAGLDSLKFSFNASDREEYRSLTGVDAFDTQVKNINTALAIREEVYEKTKHRCGVYASSIKYDIAQPRRMKEALSKIKVDQHYWLPLYNQAGYTKNARGKKSIAGNSGRVGALRPSLPCWALFTEGHVTWDGMLAGCCFSHEPNWHFGDLDKVAFMDAWNSPKAQELREANLKGDVGGTACEKCINCQ